MSETEVPFTGVTYLGVIGRGSFGVVHLVENNHHEQFAIKVMAMSGASPKDRELARNEVNVLRRLRHYHVVIYEDSWLHQGRMHIITEFCAGGDLSSFLGRLSRHLPEELVLVWLWQMTCGLEYMHSFKPTPILHRDLKPSNIYLTDTGDIRLGDMGIARILEAPNVMVESFCGTPTYMSPEVLHERPYNEKTDIWSLGCCLAEVVNLERAYEGSTLNVLRLAVLKGPPPVPEGYSQSLRGLLAGLLKWKYEERPSATNILDDHCLLHYENEQPLRLLIKYKLHHDKLGLRGTHPHSASGSLSSTSTSTSSTSSSSSTSSTQTIDLDQGQSYREYRDKVRSSMRGRGRPEDETLRSSTGGLDPVLHTSFRGEGKRKTEKKTLVTVVSRDSLQTVVSSKESDSCDRESESRVRAPESSGKETGTRNRAPEPRDQEYKSRDSTTSAGADGDSNRGTVPLGRRLLASFSSSLVSLQSQRLGSQNIDMSMPLDLPVLSEASLLDQMALLKTVLIAMLGEDSWNEACALVVSAPCMADLRKGLAPLLGDLTGQLMQIIIYCQLAESVAAEASPK